MIYFTLFYKFILIGLFSIGGGYTFIPLVSDVADDFGIISDEMISNFIAIAESTPGPVSVNLATFVGTLVAGPIGAIVATLSLILPAFLIIIFFAIFLKIQQKNKKVNDAFRIIRVCAVGIIMATGLSLLCKCMIKDVVDIKSILIAFFLFLIMFVYKKISKKSISTITVFIIGAILGILINMF